MTRPVVVITGASRGIGKRLAVDFAAAGYDVACLARSTEGSGAKLPGTIDETAEAVRAAGGAALPIGIDIRSEEAVEAAAERVYGEFGRCDVLINNAAVAVPGKTMELPTKLWRVGVDVNVNGPLYTTVHFGRRTMEATGRIINVSSNAAWMPEFGRINYLATKRALEGMTEGFAFELRGKIAVNCIRIELMIWTEGFAETLGNPDERTGFEDPVIMSDAALWLAKQPLDYTGHILTLGELRNSGVVRAVTPA